MSDESMAPGISVCQQTSQSRSEEVGGCVGGVWVCVCAKEEPRWVEEPPRLNERCHPHCPVMGCMRIHPVCDNNSDRGNKGYVNISVGVWGTES